MESADSSSVDDIVKKMKMEMMLSNIHISPSAYDTAWVAMIPNISSPAAPMFKECLHWLLSNQKSSSTTATATGGGGEGYWGESETAIDSLSSTLACLIALKKWDVGPELIQKGVAFIQANAERLVMELGGDYPRWFAIVFPAMLDLADSAGLHLFPQGLLEGLKDIYKERQRILTEEDPFYEKYNNIPLIGYLEALPPSYDGIDDEQILKNQSKDGSLFHSPSSTAAAYMITGDKRCLAYLKSIVPRCGHGVPPVYPIDEQLIKLCLVDRLERLGLAEYFVDEIKDILSHAYRDWINKEEEDAVLESGGGSSPIPRQLYKDSLAFRLLRMHGYHVTPRKFCWFLGHRDLLLHMDENCGAYLSAMVNIHRAGDVMFAGEDDLAEATSFSRHLLKKGISMRNIVNDGVLMFDFQTEIEHQLKLPWLARLDHLEHRICIEESCQRKFLWMGKASSFRISCLDHNSLIQLAANNYTLRQSIYKIELEELKRWSEKSGLRDMGFSREKTEYLYFASATTAWHPSQKDVRIVSAKAGILVTVIDDFYDMEGSIDELRSLTHALQKWEGDGLSGHCKTIFAALDNFISELLLLASKTLHYDPHDIKDSLRALWYETCVSWLREGEWSRGGHAPSIDEYLEVGMTSIAVHTILISTFYVITPCHRHYHPHHPHQYPIKLVSNNNNSIGSAATITKLLMLSSRLLNDLQSYEKEIEDGKMNLVMLYLKENPWASMEDSIAYIKEIVDRKKKEMVEHVLVEGMSDLPPAWKQLHLASLKAFSMFFNSTNGFDSPTEMLENINKAFYLPLQHQESSFLLDHHLQSQQHEVSKGSEERRKLNDRDYSVIKSHFIPSSTVPRNSERRRRPTITLRITNFTTKQHVVDDQRSRCKSPYSLRIRSMVNHHVFPSKSLHDILHSPRPFA